MASESDIPVKNLNTSDRIPFDVLRFVPEDSATHYRFLPLEVKDGVLEVGMVDPDDIEARDALHFITSKTNLPFKIYLISEADFTEAMKSYEGLSGQVDKALGQLEQDVKEGKDAVATVAKEEKE